MSEAEKEKESGEREREGEVGYSLQKSLRWRTREGGMCGDGAEDAELWRARCVDLEVSCLSPTIE